MPLESDHEAAAQFMKARAFYDSDLEWLTSVVRDLRHQCAFGIYREAVVWPYDDAPFTGAQVKELMAENARLRADNTAESFGLQQALDWLKRYDFADDIHDPRVDDLVRFVREVLRTPHPLPREEKT